MNILCKSEIPRKSGHCKGTVHLAISRMRHMHMLPPEGFRSVTTGVYSSCEQKLQNLRGRKSQDVSSSNSIPSVSTLACHGLKSFCFAVATEVAAAACGKVSPASRKVQISVTFRCPTSFRCPQIDIQWILGSCYLCSTVYEQCDLQIGGYTKVVAVPNLLRMYRSKSSGGDT